MSAKTMNEELSDSAAGPRCREPEHFLLRVECFSEYTMEKYESGEFQAGGYKWKLILYPNGDKERDGSNHISLYISISDTQNLPSGWQVEADFCLFVYNSVSRKYLTYKLADKTLFNWLNMEAGFAQLIPLDEFKEASNGYLFVDTCVFGAEIYVTGSSAAKRQTLTSLKKIDIKTNRSVFVWTVENFSTLNESHIKSEKFISKDVKWCLELYPKGYSTGKDKSISLYLHIADDELTKLAGNQTFIRTTFNTRIRNQLDSNHVEKLATSNFCKSTSTNWGSHNFIPLSDVNDESKGFLMNDSLVVEVEIVKVEYNQLPTPNNLLSSICKCLWW